MARKQPERRQPRARGALELEVLTCLGASRRAMTAAQVQEEIGGGIAYTTVMTTLSRLHAKGALDRAAVGRAYEYSLVGGARGARSSMTAHQMLKLLDEQPDRTAVLTRFVAELNRADEKVLSRLLAQEEPPAATAPPAAATRKTRRRVGS